MKLQRDRRGILLENARLWTLEAWEMLSETWALQRMIASSRFGRASSPQARFCRIHRNQTRIRLTV
jgi:hypothetical protein